MSKPKMGASFKRGQSQRSQKASKAKSTPPRHFSTMKANPDVEPKSKLASIIALLSRPKGASIDELSYAAGWQPHSVRGAISRTIKKVRKFNVVSDKIDGIRRYRIPTSAAR
jgi:hypothetical protein